MAVEKEQWTVVSDVSSSLQTKDFLYSRPILPEAG